MFLMIRQHLPASVPQKYDKRWLLILSLNFVQIHMGNEEHTYWYYYIGPGRICCG